MLRIRNGVCLLLSALMLMSFQPLSARSEERKVYRIGVIPTWPPVVTHTDWSPFVARLINDTGLALRLKVYENMSDFEHDILTPEAPDFIFANALQIVVAHREQGFLPLIRGGNAIQAELFVRKDSPTRTVDDLEGKKIAFVGEKNL